MHEHNVDELLACALPFHATPQFVRLVHLLTPQVHLLTISCQIGFTSHHRFMRFDISHFRATFLQVLQYLSASVAVQ